MEILVFTYGDSLDISTWSNVPYLFTKTLEDMGHKVYRVDISPNRFIEQIYNKISYHIFKKFLKRKETSPKFHMTWLHRHMTYFKIKRATKQHPEIQFNLFLSYYFYNKYSSKPNILWHDWSYRLSIERFGREPYTHELESLKQEDLAIKKADKVYTMFPKCKEIMERIHGRDFIYLNRNVVNTVYDSDFNIKENITERVNSSIILFVGNYKYKDAAEKLAKAFQELYKNDNTLELHIIGIKKDDFYIKHTQIYCHGYLRKNIKEERDLYYKLLLSCKVFINPAEKWGGYSSTIEAMYYGSPIIISPYDDFVKEFGEDINFGIYLKDDLVGCIKNIIYCDETSYKQLCMNSNERVADYSWSKYVDEFIESLGLQE